MPPVPLLPLIPPFQVSNCPYFKRYENVELLKMVGRKVELNYNVAEWLQ
jgi:hypothetical protein